MKGKVDVLHTAAGHLEMEFKDAAQAGEEITGLMRRGYMILVTVNGEDHRVTSFDARTGEYVVQETRKVWFSAKEVEERVKYETADAKAIAPDPQTRTAAPADTLPPQVPALPSPGAAPPPAPPVQKVREETVETRVPYKEAKVTAVAPISGG